MCPWKSVEECFDMRAFYHDQLHFISLEAYNNTHSDASILEKKSTQVMLTADGSMCLR